MQERLNAEVNRRLEAGEQLQGPSRQQLSGTVYFGLTVPAIAAAIEGVDPGRTCSAYWKSTRVRLQSTCCSRSARGAASAAHA